MSAPALPVPGEADARDAATARIVDGPLALEVARFGAPLALGMALQTAFNLVDAYLVAQLPHAVAGARAGRARHLRPDRGAGHHRQLRDFHRDERPPLTAARGRGHGRGTAHRLAVAPHGRRAERGLRAIGNRLRGAHRPRRRRREGRGRRPGDALPAGDRRRRLHDLLPFAADGHAARAG